jgi:vacuolar protein 8
MDQLEEDLRGLVRVLEDASAGNATKANAAGKLARHARGDWGNPRTKAVVVAGAIPSLVELLRGGLNEGKKNAAAALGMIAPCSDATAAMVAAGALPMLVELLRSGSDKGKATAAGALANLMANNNDDSNAAVVVAGVILLLVQLLRGVLAPGQTNAAAALRALLGSTDDNRAAVVAAGALLPLVELMRDGGGAGQDRNATRALVQPLETRRVAAPSGGTRLHPRPTKSVVAQLISRGGRT